jgi:predicted O-linked N-acetylglucosamine transferase (SPINDLY family)
MANINMAQYTDSGDESGKRVKYEYLSTALDLYPNNSMVNHMMGHFHFDKKDWLKSIQFLDRAYELDNRALEAATSAIYIRFTICHWGRNGSQYRKDLQILSGAAKKEWESAKEGAAALGNSNIHPHMSLGYALDPFHKLAIATNYANREKRMVLHSGMKPFDDTSASSRKRFLKQSKKKAFRIKVGYVSANIKSKTTVYMAQVRV